MTKYFRLAISDNTNPTTPKSVIEWWKSELFTPRSLKPVMRGQDKIWITDFDDSDSGLMAYAEAVKPGATVGEDLEAPVVFMDLSELGPNRVELDGRCDDFMADFIRLKIEHVKETWPATLELTPEGASQDNALTWAEILQAERPSGAGDGQGEPGAKSAQAKFTLPTTPDRFTTWLENHTQAAYTQAGGWFGGYSLQPARRMVRTDKRNVWRMAALSENADIKNAISFEIEDNSPERIKVTAECILGELSLIYKYFFGLLVAIGDEWPEAREGINRAFGVTDKIPQTTPTSGAREMTTGDFIGLASRISNGDKSAEIELQAYCEQSGEDYAEYLVRARQLPERLRLIQELFEHEQNDPVRQMIRARLSQPEITNDPVLGAILDMSEKDFLDAVRARLTAPITIPPLPTSGAGDGQAEPNEYDLAMLALKKRLNQQAIDRYRSIDAPASAALSKGQDKEESARSTPTEERRIKLRRILDELFNIGELCGLCFDMHIDFEELAGETKPDKVIALIEFCKRRGRTSELETKVYALRPNASLEDMPE